MPLELFEMQPALLEYDHGQVLFPIEPPRKHSVSDISNVEFIKAFYSNDQLWLRNTCLSFGHEFVRIGCW